MKRFVVLFCLVLIPISVFAKPKKKTFNNSAEQLFAATLRTARERHVITYVNEKQLMMTFETGMSVWSYGFVANASIEAEGTNRATLIINVQNKKGLSMGAGDRMTDKFFEQVQDELAGDPKQKSEIHTDAKAIDVPPPKAIPEEPTMTKSLVPTLSEASKGSISIICQVSGAELFVDDAFVGNTPATIKLTPGKHIISVRKTGLKTWQRELAVLEGSEVKLNVELEKID